MLRFLFRTLFRSTRELSHKPVAVPRERPQERHPVKRAPTAPPQPKATPDEPLARAPFDPASAHFAKAGRVLRGRAYVTDGETIVIDKVQIRLFGVDAPELNHPFGQKAKWAMVRLCKGQEVLAEVLEEDAHGRTVAHCTLQDGRDLSAEMVKLGLALDWPKFSGGQYRSIEAPDARKKLWLAAARLKGRMHVWDKFDANQAERR